jgi:nucleotide-binding universal stress UspA family protein
MTYAPSFGPVPVPQSTIDDQYAVLRAHLSAVASHSALSGLSVGTEVLTGPAAVTLLGAIETGQIDLVVMNSHGRAGVVRWLLGSVAEHIVHYATVPLLILRERDSAGAIQNSATAAGDLTVATSWRALVGLDSSALAEEALAPTVSVLQALSGTGRSRLHVVHIERPLSDADDLEPVLGSTEQRSHRRQAPAPSRAASSHRPSALSAHALECRRRRRSRTRARHALRLPPHWPASPCERGW